MRLVFVAVGQLVVVVPAVLAVLVAVAVGADAGEFGEGEVAGFGEFTDADRTAARVEREVTWLAVGTVMVLSSTWALFSTRRSARRGALGVALAAVTRLIGSSPRSRSRVW